MLFDIIREIQLYMHKNQNLVCIWKGEKLKDHTFVLNHFKLYMAIIVRGLLGTCLAFKLMQAFLNEQNHIFYYYLVILRFVLNILKQQHTHYTLQKGHGTRPMKTIRSIIATIVTDDKTRPSDSIQYRYSCFSHAMHTFL